jgi:phage-related protein
MLWSAYQYGKVWDEAYASCDGDAQATFDRKLEFLQQHGNLSGRPVTAPLGDGILELRAKDVRVLFYFGDKREIIFVHWIVKKTRNVPPEDIKSGKKKRAEIQSGAKKKNALSG